ncbi:MAG: hypothetical protein RQ868_04650 [Meiothermus sp.]|nr:hypothetical protein [Meiothermus sp.]MDT7919861.1 hypothetical protein [Meiothermus sp.]
MTLPKTTRRALAETRASLGTREGTTAAMVGLTRPSTVWIRKTSG